jgi:lysophospholipase L1-like esterase
MPVRTVLCYGDSNTHGTVPMRDLLHRERHGPQERWPGVLAACLGSDWLVVEAGLPGRTTTHPDPVIGDHMNGLAVLPAVLGSAAPVDLVVMMLGTNDLKHRFQMPPVEIAVCIERLVLGVANSFCGPERRAPGLLLVAPPPVVETGCLAEVFEGGAAKAARLGRIYREVAERHGVAFLDAGRLIAVSEVDGVHFDADAHAGLGQAVAAAVLGLDLQP